MDIQYIILNYLLIDREYSDINAEPQVRFNVLNLQLLKVRSFISSLRKDRASVTIDNYREGHYRLLVELLENIEKQIVEESETLGVIAVEAKVVEKSTYNNLSSKNQGKD